MNTVKNKRISIRFDDEQYDNLTTKAKENNMDLTAYIREKIFFDIPNLEQHSFEFKILKSISYCVGAIRGLINIKEFSSEEKKIIDAEILKIMLANGLDESQVKIKRD